MILFKRVAALKRFLARRRAAGDRVGFVPTMGALHEGHLSLLRLAGRDNDLTVCSIFVNPSQFNEAADLEKYPRTPSKDIDMLSGVGTNVLFMPPVDEIYPPGQELSPPVDLGMLDRVLEGEFRPGHFAGVAAVVRRLLDIVGPCRLYMGQKDYQQFTIIQHLIDRLGLPVRLVVGPTVREADGLAMSSRNQRLSPDFRQRAAAIHRTLVMARDLLTDLPAEEIEKLALHALRDAGLRPEYFEIVDGATLSPVEDAARTVLVVACAAAWAGEVRLIDNLVLKGHIGTDAS